MSFCACLFLFSVHPSHLFGFEINKLLANLPCSFVCFKIEYIFLLLFLTVLLLYLKFLLVSLNILASSKLMFLSKLINSESTENDLFNNLSLILV